MCSFLYTPTFTHLLRTQWERETRRLVTHNHNHIQGFLHFSFSTLPLTLNNFMPSFILFLLVFSVFASTCTVVAQTRFSCACAAVADVPPTLWFRETRNAVFLLNLNNLQAFIRFLVGVLVCVVLCCGANSKLFVCSCNKEYDKRIRIAHSVKIIKQSTLQTCSTHLYLRIY